MRGVIERIENVRASLVFPVLKDRLTLDREPFHE